MINCLIKLSIKRTCSNSGSKSPVHILQNSFLSNSNYKAYRNIQEHFVVALDVG